jgi:5-formaminoimidazole-4-carboxamide-1-(beta)-D-ribofuranosyl 5'-monophosphate synthetase
MNNTPGPGALPIRIATLGSHSALQILKGGHDEGFETIAICQPRDVKLYKRYPFVKDIVEIPRYAAFFDIEPYLLQRQAIVIPHGTFVAYLSLDDHRRMRVPYFGNKAVLEWEADRSLQREWLERAGLQLPTEFSSPDEVDCPVLVKMYGAAGGKGYFVARNTTELHRKLARLSTDRYVIQEYIIGAPVFLHFFYSPLSNKIEFFGLDKRYETNVDSLGRIPSDKQEQIAIEASFEVVGNLPVAIRESLLGEAMSLGERVVATSRELFPPRGLFGPFCVETLVTPGRQFFVMEISARIVAGTNPFLTGSPYASLLGGRNMSTGRRIARELRLALQQDRLAEVLAA